MVLIPALLIQLLTLGRCLSLITAKFFQRENAITVSILLFEEIFGFSTGFAANHKFIPGNLPVMIGIHGIKAGLAKRRRITPDLASSRSHAEFFLRQVAVVIQVLGIEDFLGPRAAMSAFATTTGFGATIPENRA